MWTLYPLSVGVGICLASEGGTLRWNVKSGPFCTDWAAVSGSTLPDSLAGATNEWASRLAAGPTRAIGFSKRLLNRAIDSDLAAALDEEAAVQALNRGSAKAFYRELADRVCLSRWASCGSSDARRFR